MIHREDKKYLKKKYQSEEQKKIDDHQRVEQSSLMQDVKRFEETAMKNADMFKDQVKGEEGIDYQVMPRNFTDPDMPNDKILEKQIRHEINLLKV